MTEQEIQEFIEIVKLSPEHYYEVLGLKPFSEYKKNNFQERYDYAKREFSKDEMLKAHQFLSEAKKKLASKTNKHIYDAELKLKFERKLKELVKNFVVKDKILDKDEREIIEDKGVHFNFSISEIHNIIEEQRKKYNFNDDKTNTKEKETSSKTTKTGSPKLEIHNNPNLKKNGEFLFDNVKLTETRREVVTIKNGGGGGTLDATAFFLAKWIEVIPKKIHQSKLPQDVTIVVDPSKDRSLKNGSAIKDTINLTYATSEETIRAPIEVKMAIEGHHNLVKRQTKNATIVSSILASLMLLYIFLTFDFSGWEIFGFVVSAIAIGIGVFAAVESEENMGILIIGGLILLITNWTIFSLLSIIVVTFYVAKFVFRKNPFRNELIAAIPIGSFAIFLMLFFGVSNLPYSNSSHQRNYQNSKTQKAKSKSTIPINKYAYIKADPIGNIRKGTTTNTDILTSLNKGEKIYIIEQDKASRWYKVRYRNNRIGFASNKIIDFNYVASKKNKSKVASKSTNTKKYNNSKFILSSSVFIGNWNINNSRSKYKFYSNNKGKYISSRGKTISFSWSYNTNNSNYLKIILNTDKSVWNWKLQSYSKNQITMYNSKNNLSRVISKL